MVASLLLFVSDLLLSVEHDVSVKSAMHKPIEKARLVELIDTPYTCA
jgi:hypothetical protein